MQQYGINFDQIFTIIIKLIVFKVLFIIAIFYNLNIDQINIKIVFFHDFINQLIYIKILKKIKIKANKNIIYKLLKALYSLEQFFCFWFKRLYTCFLKSLSFKEIYADYSIFIINKCLNRSIMNTFVDNIKIINIKKSGFIKKIKEKLIAAFSIVDINFISFYLSLKLSWNWEKINK